MNIYEQLNKIDDEESLKEASELTNYQKIMRALDDMDDSKTIASASKGAHAEVDASSSSKSTKDLGLTNYEKIMRALDNMDDSKTVDSAARGADTKADASAREFLRKREKAHREVWNLIHDLRVKYKYSLREVEDIIDYELKRMSQVAANQ